MTEARTATDRTIYRAAPVAARERAGCRERRLYRTRRSVNNNNNNKVSGVTLTLVLVIIH